MNARRRRSRYRTTTSLPESTADDSRVGVPPLSGDDNEAPTSEQPAEQEEGDGSEEFAYSMEFDKEYGWMLKVTSGCPECGNDALFNGSFRISPQFAGYKKDEEENMLLGQDDVVHIQVDYLWCGNCEEVVVDNRCERVEDARYQ